MIRCKEKLSKEYLLSLYKSFGTTTQSIGLEYERLPIYTSDNSTVSYYGELGVCDILKEFARIDNWDYILDDNEIIGLKKIHDSITLEPGSQVELSLPPKESVSEIEQKLNVINSELIPLFEKYGIKLFNYGIYPLTTYKNINIIPKKRYKLMANYLWGILSDVMMRETAGIQVNIDYKDEFDAIRKFNLANKMSPFMTAMFANSNIRGGVNTGYKTFRSLAWLNTDNERCGFATKFNKNMTFEDYLNTLLSVPMIFIKRDDEYINIDGKINFKTFMDKGYLSYTATLDDFLLHSNLFFPEVRLRKYIEIRNHDCCNEKYMYSLLAIYKGIFYNENAMFAVEDLLSELTINDISEFRYNIPRTALDTKVKGVKVNDITSKIIDIAHDSLKSTNDEDIKYLEPISILNKQGKTPCDVVEMPIV